jgi:hypothetical protein
LFIFLKDQQGKGEDESVHYNCPLDFTGSVLCRALCAQKNQEHCNIQHEGGEGGEHPFHCQQYKKNATVLHVIVNNAWMLVVDILNI